MNTKSHQGNNRGIRFTALVTVFVFVVTSVSWNSPVSGAPSETIPTVFSSIGKLVIPAEMGSIQRKFLGTRSSELGKMKDKNGSLVPIPDSRCVVLIQDAHAVIDAQENIRKILGHLRKEYGVNLTALEGAKGRLEPLLLRTFPEPNVKRKILVDYEKRAELSGPEMESVFQETPGEFVGMEDWALYEKNYGAYLAAQNNKDSLMTQWQAFKKSLDAERSKVFYSQLNEFQDAWEGYASDKSSLLDLLTYLSRFSKQLKTGSDYQELPGLISLMDYEKTGKQSVLEPMVRKIADDFKTKYLRGLGVKATTNFFSRYQAFMTGQITTGQMLQYLVHLGDETGKKPKLTPALKMLLGHAQTLSEIKGSRLYDELRRFLPEVQESLFRNAAQRELAEKYQRLFLLKDMIALELTHEDLAKYQRESKGCLSLIRSPAFEENLRPALEFYKVALERDRVFMSKIEALMQKQTSDQRPATIAVVAGGFHTGGLERILREKRIAYAVVTPKIASLAGSENYFKVMNGNVSFKEYLNTTYFDALMRHSAKALTEALPIPDQARTLKVWRDNVIRELASESRIAEAGKYLPYIDELLQNHGEAVSVGSSRSNEKILSVLRTELEKAKKDLFERIWKTFEFQLGTFTDDLKELIAQKDLNTQTVSALIDRASQTKPSFLGLRVALSMAPVPFPTPGFRKVIGPRLFAPSETREAEEKHTRGIAAMWRVFLKKAGAWVSILSLGAIHAAAVGMPMYPMRPPEKRTNDVSSIAAPEFEFIPSWLRARDGSNYPSIPLRPREKTLLPISHKPLVSAAAEKAAIAFLGAEKFNGYLNLYSTEDRDTIRYMIQILTRTNPELLQFMVDRPVHIVRLPNNSKELTSNSHAKETYIVRLPDNSKKFPVTSNLYTDEFYTAGIVLDNSHIGIRQSEWEMFDQAAKEMLANNRDGLDKKGPANNLSVVLTLRYVAHELTHLMDKKRGLNQGFWRSAFTAREKHAFDEQARMEVIAGVSSSTNNNDWEEGAREQYDADYDTYQAQTVRNQLIIGIPGVAPLVFALFLKKRRASVLLPDRHKPLTKDFGQAAQQSNLSYPLHRQRDLKGARLNSAAKYLQSVRPGSRPSTPRRSEVRSKREGLLGKFVAFAKANQVRVALLVPMAAATWVLTSCAWVWPHGAEVASGSVAALTEGRLSWADVNVTNRMRIANSPNTSPEELLSLVEDTIRRLEEFDSAKFNKELPDHYDQEKVDNYMALGTVFYAAAGNPSAAIATNRNVEGKTIKELLVEARGKLGQGPVSVGEKYVSAQIPEEFDRFTDLFKSVGTGFWNSTDPFLPKKELEGFAGWSSDPLVNPYGFLPWDEDVLRQLASWTDYFYMTRDIKEALLFGMIVTPRAADTNETARLEMVIQYIRMSTAVTYPLNREEWLRVFRNPDPLIRCNGLRGLNVPPEVAAQALKDNWENFTQGVAVEKKDLSRFLPSMEKIRGTFLDWDSPGSIWKRVEGSPTKVRLNTPLFLQKTDDDFRLAVGRDYDATTLQEYLECLRARTASEFPSWHPLRSPPVLLVWKNLSQQFAPAHLENSTTNTGVSIPNRAIVTAIQTGNSAIQNPAANPGTGRPEARQNPLSASPGSADGDHPILDKRSELRFFQEPLRIAVAGDFEGIVALARTAGTGEVRATLLQRGRAILGQQSQRFETRLSDLLFRMQPFPHREFQERVLEESILRGLGNFGVTTAMAAEIATRAVAGDAKKSGVLSEFIDGGVTWKRDELARMVQDRVALRRAMTKLTGTSHGPYALMTEWKGTAGDAPLLRRLSSLELSRLILLSDGDEKVHLNRAMLEGVAPIVQVRYRGSNVESAIGQAIRKSNDPVLCLLREVYDFTLEHQYTLTLEDQKIVTPQLRDLALEVARSAILIFMAQDRSVQKAIIDHPAEMIPLLKQYGVTSCVQIGRNGQLFVSLEALMSSYVSGRAVERAA